MQIILQEDVEKLGHRGDVVTVKPGYARNFLLPNKIGIEATVGNMKALERIRGALAKKTATELDAAKKQAELLNGVAVKFHRKTGENDQMFGSVTTGDIAEDFDGDGIFAEGFDGIGELDLALIDLEVLRGETFGDVGGGDGAEHLVVLAGLAGEVERHAVEQLGLFVSSVKLRGGFFRKRSADALERFHVPDAGFDGELAGQQVISCVAGLDADDLAAVSQLIYIFLKNDLHFLSLSS